MKEAQEALMALGFSDYESRAYCALLEQSPANGYQIAKLSGIPRGKIYECLERLITRHAIVQIETADDAPKMFAPADPLELIDSIEEDINTSCSRARSTLEQFRNKQGVVEVLWRVTSQKDLIARGKTLAGGAEHTLHIAIWDDEFDELLPQLLLAAKRGVKLALVLYSPHDGIEALLELGAGAVQHSRTKREAVSVMGRQFVLVADRERCITGSIFTDGDVEGVYTRNRGLVTNAVDLVNHEIYLERILEKVGEPVLEVFGRDLSKLDAFDRPENL